MSTSVTCAPGFTRVCPMMEDVCPGDTMMMCPGGMPPAAGRMMHGSSGSSGCQCVPDFLMALVHHAMPAATRLDATDRATDVIKNEKVKLGKRTCTCTFTMETKGTRCSGQAKCDKKCTGTGAVDVDPYSFTLAVKKGKGKISKCTVAAMPTVGPVEPTGSGSGPVPTGSGTGPVPPTGSGSGMENPMSRCTCVGNGGSGPTPPTGSGTGPGPNPPTGTGSGSGPNNGYTQTWLRGTADAGFSGHPHEGLRLEGGDGWVGVGETLGGENDRNPIQVVVTRIDNEGNTVWTQKVGDTTNGAKNIGFGIAQSGDKLYVGTGLWQKSSSNMKPAVVALDTATGGVAWTKVLDSQSKNGGVRGVIVDGGRIICTGYVKNGIPGYQFVADDGAPAVWELDTDGNLVKEKVLSIDGLGQGAKIRKDLSSGYVMASTGWGELGGEEANVVIVVKLTSNLDVEWNKMYGKSGGHSQMFDLLVDKDGNYLMGGHTTVGDGVVNWDYLALKVNSQTKEEEWRKTYGQPRGFDARYIHDEMYGVAMDPAGNYLLLGGSGDEYSYSETNSDGWNSDTWVSYLVVVDPQGNTLHEGVYGDKEGNNAGEYLSVDTNTGEVMVYTDSDTVEGFGWLKLTPK